jgi:hypothetical protein
MERETLVIAAEMGECFRSARQSLNWLRSETDRMRVQVVRSQQALADSHELLARTEAMKRLRKVD